jgi:hypothetical protein
VTKLEECNTVTGMVRYEQQLLTCHCDCHCQTARLIRPKNKKYQTNRDQKETLERPSRGGQGPMENSCCWRQLEEQADRVSVSVFSAGGFGTWFLENGGPVDRYGPFFLSNYQNSHPQNQQQPWMRSRPNRFYSIL